jgi:hypothetical protein
VQTHIVINAIIDNVIVAFKDILSLMESAKNVQMETVKFNVQFKIVNYVKILDYVINVVQDFTWKSFTLRVLQRMFVIHAPKIVITNLDILK